MKKNIIFGIFALLLLNFSACYKEETPIDDLWTKVGDVAYIVALTASNAAPAPNTALNLTLKCSAVNTTMKEIKLYQKVGTAAETLYSTTPFTANFVEAERLHVLTIPYTAPNVKGTSVVLRAVVVTVNDLSSLARTVTIKTTN